MSDSPAAPVSRSSQNPSQSQHNVTTEIHSKSDENSDIQKLVNDPSIPPYLKGAVPNLYHIDPRDILEILKGREAREKKFVERREREERRLAGEIVASPPSTPKKPESPPRPYFQWGRSWARNPDETKAFGFARKRAHRLLVEEQAKTEPEDVTMSAVAAAFLLPPTLASDTAAAASDHPSQESRGRQRRRFLPTTTRKRSISPQYVPATPSPKRKKSTRVESAHRNTTHRAVDAGWNNTTLVETTSSKVRRDVTTSDHTKASESLSFLQPSPDESILHPSYPAPIRGVRHDMDPAHFIQIPLVAFDELLATRRQLSQENNMLRERLRLVQGGEKLGELTASGSNCGPR